MEKLDFTPQQEEFIQRCMESTAKNKVGLFAEYIAKNNLQTITVPEGFYFMDKETYEQKGFYEVYEQFLNSLKQ